MTTKHDPADDNPARRESGAAAVVAAIDDDRVTTANVWRMVDAADFEQTMTNLMHAAEAIGVDVDRLTAEARRNHAHQSEATPRRLPDDPTAANRVRATWAGAAVAIYTAYTNHGATFSPDHPDAPQIIADLFGDLAHLARACGIDPDEATERGRCHFAEEEAEAAAAEHGH